jgi:hypothetical protein
LPTIQVYKKIGLFTLLIKPLKNKYRMKINKNKYHKNIVNKTPENQK